MEMSEVYYFDLCLDAIVYRQSAFQAIVLLILIYNLLPCALVSVGTTKTVLNVTINQWKTSRCTLRLC
jgi:hypothetical protein